MAKPIIMKMDTPQDKYLLYLVEQGMWDKYGEHANGQDGDMVVDYMQYEVMPRIKEELRVITNAGFTNYFLIVGDFVKWCRGKEIALGSRGSAGGSVVAYCLDITDDDPLEYGLIFERFLNDERLSMPDIDLDICWARRQEALEYLFNKYGEDHVSQIVTFGTLSAKALIDDLGRVFNIPSKDIKELKSFVPQAVDGDDKVSEESKVRYVDLMEDEAFVAKLHEIDRIDSRFVPAMARLEGLHRHGSMHAGGIIISDVPMNDLAPTYKPPKAKRSMVQYEMMDAEAVGLLKIDALGLRTVTHVDWGERDARRLYDPNFYTKGYRMNDQAAFDIINAGDTYGIFQLEGTGITRFAQQMRVESFNDITALLALYRPGPLDSGMAQKYIARKNGLEQVEYPHPDLEELLRETYGIIVYQEQVMAIARTMAGFSWGESDVLRSAMGKKNKKKIDEELAKFKVGALARGYAIELIDLMTEQIVTFARYGFNKSHAVRYGKLTYWQAVMKARFPVAFFTAWLNVTDDGGKKGWIIDQAARKHIKILPPDINYSGDKFTATDSETIRFGLSAVKGMGASFVAKTILNRETKGPFTSYYNFCERVTSVPVDKKEALVGAGAFDFEAAIDPSKHRGVLFEAARRVSDLAKKSKDPEYLTMEPMKPLEMGELEKEYVNFYITDDPIKGIQEEIKMLGGFVGVPASEMMGEPIIGGRLSNVHTLKTKKGDTMAFIDVDDGIIQHSVTMFPNVWERVKDHMVKDAYTAMRCDIGTYKGQPALQAIAVFPVDLNNRNSDLVVDLGYAPSRMSLAMVKMALDAAEVGTCSVRMVVSNDKHRFALKSEFYTIRITDEVIAALKSALGPNAITLDRRS